MNILETKRLVLRTINEKDFHSLYEEVFSNEEVVKFTFGKELFTLEESKKFMKDNCNFDNKLGLSTLIEKDTKKIIGLAGVIECEYLNTIDYEFGFILGKNYWGKGYAKEIGQAQIDFIKQEIKTNRVLALVDESNDASVKTIEKLGLSYLRSITTEGRGNRKVYFMEIE